MRVAYLFIIDVDFGLALGHDGKLAVTPLNTWQQGEQVISSTHIVENAVLNLDGHAARGHLVLRYLALYHHAADAVGLRMHDDGAYLAHADAAQQGLVTDAGGPDGYALGVAGYDEVAVFIAYAAVEECGISIAKQ